jgi:hypothetical protein
MQNSNSRSVQRTLVNESLEEERWSCLGFISIEVLDIRPSVWHLPLSDELLDRVYEALDEQKKRAFDRLPSVDGLTHIGWSLAKAKHLRF